MRGVVLGLLWMLCITVDADPTNVVAVREALLSDSDGSAPRPLPVAASWQNGGYSAFQLSSTPTKQQTDAAYMVSLLEAGEYVWPTLAVEGASFRPEGFAYSWQTYVEEPVAQLRAWGMPLHITTTQPEMCLYTASCNVGGVGTLNDIDGTQWTTLPEADNPAAFTTAGAWQAILDPIGPDLPWQQIAQQYWGQDRWSDVYDLYPDAPKVFILQNNEPTRMKQASHTVDTQWARYVDLYGTGTSRDAKNKAISQGYRDRYEAYFDAAKSTLGWGNAIRFIGYGVGGAADYARWADYKNYIHAWDLGASDYSLYQDYLPWDGGSWNQYMFGAGSTKTDQYIYSPFVNAMNDVWHLEKIREGDATTGVPAKPYFFHEISIYGGFPGELPNYEGLMTPQRFKSYIRTLMWLSTPRVVRYFMGSTVYLEDIAYNSEYTQGDYFQQMLDAVSEVHKNATLHNFWQNSDLVYVTARTHPYRTDEIDAYDTDERWNFLKTNKEVAGWDSDTFSYLTDEVQVWAIARRLGNKYLLVLFSPDGFIDGVQVTIPGSDVVSIGTVGRDGGFWLYDDATNALTKIDIDGASSSITKKHRARR